MVANTVLATWVLANATLDSLVTLAPHLVLRVGLATFVIFQFATTIVIIADTASFLVNANATMDFPELIVSKFHVQMTASAMANAMSRVPLVLMVPSLHPFLKTKTPVQ